LIDTVLLVATVFTDSAAVFSDFLWFLSFFCFVAWGRLSWLGYRPISEFHCYELNDFMSVLEWRQFCALILFFYSGSSICVLLALVIRFWITEIRLEWKCRCTKFSWITVNRKIKWTNM